MEWVAAAVGIGQALFGIGGAKKQKKVDQAQTMLTFRDTLEKIRRREFEIEQTKGTAKAFSETAGVLHTGGSTAQVFLDTMATEFQKELDWMREYAVEAQKLGMKSADVSYRTNLLRSVSGGLSTYAGFV